MTYKSATEFERKVRDFYRAFNELAPHSQLRRVPSADVLLHLMFHDLPAHRAVVEKVISEARSESGC